MKVLCKSFVLAALFVGSPLLAHASTWSCPPVTENALADEIQCLFSNHGRRPLDVTVTFYNNANGRPAESLVATVPPNGSVVLESIFFGSRSCTVTFRGSKRATSAAMMIHRGALDETSAAACQ